MDQIKAAFQKVKEDMDSMREEIDVLKQFLYENNQKLTQFEEAIQDLTFQITQLNLKEIANPPISNPAHPSQNPSIPTDNPAHNIPFEALKPQNSGISTGNGGVPADRQTNQQTDQHIETPSFGEALDILSSLDNLKKEVRNKFKRITDQEFLVFSTIYQLSEEAGYVDYRTLSQKLNLTESSIRDYIGRLIKKGIPVEKTRINNKIIQLSISEKLKKIAPLPTIFQLRAL
jgi:hypothetical protein